MGSGDPAASCASPGAGNRPRLCAEESIWDALTTMLVIMAAILIGGALLPRSTRAIDSKAPPTPAFGLVHDFHKFNH